MEDRAVGSSHAYGGVVGERGLQSSEHHCGLERRNNSEAIVPEAFTEENE